MRWSYASSQLISVQCIRVWITIFIHEKIILIVRNFCQAREFSKTSFLLLLNSWLHADMISRVDALSLDLQIKTWNSRAAEAVIKYTERRAQHGISWDSQTRVIIFNDYLLKLLLNSRNKPIKNFRWMKFQIFLSICYHWKKIIEKNVDITVHATFETKLSLNWCFWIPDSFQVLSYLKSVKKHYNRGRNITV